MHAYDGGPAQCIAKASGWKARSQTNLDFPCELREFNVSEPLSCVVALLQPASTALVPSFFMSFAT